VLRVKLSERLLSLFTTRERAAAIIGDLLEAGSNSIGFWFAVARIVLALSWRVGLGVVGAAIAEQFMIEAVNWSARAPHPIRPIGSCFGVCATLVAMTAAFSLIRFGPTEPITKLSVPFALFSGVGVCFRWVPFVVPGCGIMAYTLTLISMLSGEGRRSLQYIVLAVITSGAVGFPTAYALAAIDLSHSHGYADGVSTWVGVGYLAFLLLNAIAAAAVMSRSRFRGTPDSPECAR
jgi:hypothetical protein